MRRRWAVWAEKQNQNFGRLEVRRFNLRASAGHLLRAELVL
jgi:hypothetical protein